MKRGKIAVFLFLNVLCLPFFLDAEQGNFALGLNYPGISLKAFIFPRSALELRHQSAEDVSVTGLRNYFYFSRNFPAALFCGLEGDVITFEGESSEGTGFAAELFFGGEYFFAGPFALQLDFGPAVIDLTDADTEENVNGVEFVVNFGINYYW